MLALCKHRWGRGDDTPRLKDTHTHACMCMATKNISLTEDAYERLKECKREDESFSDVVNRLTRASTSLGDGVGALPGLGAAVEDARDEFEEEMEQRDALR